MSLFTLLSFTLSPLLMALIVQPHLHRLYHHLHHHYFHYCNCQTPCQILKHSNKHRVIKLATQPYYAKLVVLYFKIIMLTIWSKSCVSWNVLWARSFVQKLCCICCTWKASPQCASSCGAAEYQKKRKCSCTGYTCVAFLLCASSSCELSNDQL